MLNDVLRGLAPVILSRYFDLIHGCCKTTKSLLFMSSTHSYLFFFLPYPDHTPAPAQEGACSTKPASLSTLGSSRPPGSLSDGFKLPEQYACGVHDVC